MGDVYEIDAKSGRVSIREETEAEVEGKNQQQRLDLKNTASEELTKNARSSAISKLIALGLTGEEIQAIIGQ